MNEQFYLGMAVGCIVNTLIVMIGLNVLLRWAKASFDKHLKKEYDEDDTETEFEDKKDEKKEDEKKKKNRYDPDWWKKGKPPPY